MYCLAFIIGAGISATAAADVWTADDCAPGDACDEQESSLKLLQMRAQKTADGLAEVPASVTDCIGQSATEASVFQGSQSDLAELVSKNLEFDTLVEGSEVRILARKTYAFAHEAPVYVPEKNWVVFVSHPYSCDGGGGRPGDCWKVPPKGKGEELFVEISYIDLQSGHHEPFGEKVWTEDIAMANGAYPAGDGESIFVASQGLGNHSAGVYKLNVNTQQVEPVITKANTGSPYNSPNDIVVDPISGMLIFCDPIYGWEQNFRPLPELGNWIWGYPTEKGAASSSRNFGKERPQDARVLIDHLSRPNGVSFASEAGDVLYVTDTGYFPGSEQVSPLKLKKAIADGGWFDYKQKDVAKMKSGIDRQAPRTIYAFDVKRDEEKNILGLTNRRVVTIATDGIPDGIKVDCEGRIYAGQENGVGVYSKDGRQLGVIKLPEGASNMVLVPRGCRTQLVIMSETKIYSLFLNTKTCLIAR